MIFIAILASYEKRRERPNRSSSVMSGEEVLVKADIRGQNIESRYQCQKLRIIQKLIPQIPLVTKKLRFA